MDIARLHHQLVHLQDGGREVDCGSPKDPQGVQFEPRLHGRERQNTAAHMHTHAHTHIDPVSRWKLAGTPGRRFQPLPAGLVAGPEN